jgi:hypothetical protein
MRKQRHQSLLVVLAVMVLAILLLSSVGLAFASSSSVTTQLAMVVDGSGSITDSDWAIILNALAKTVNESLPADGSVEFTIVQFGSIMNESLARVELAPTVINQTTRAQVAGSILSMSKIGGSTSLADGLNLAWSAIHNSSNYQSASKQVINLATDGIPNMRNMMATRDWDGNGQINAYDDVAAVVNASAMHGLDELDLELIGLSDANLWFRDNLAFPQPGGFAPPFNQTGWVRQVVGVEDFARTLPEAFQAIIGVKQGLYVPEDESALLAGAATIGATAVVSTLASAVSEPEGFVFREAAEKMSEVIPDGTKKWLSDFLKSKKKLHAEETSKSVFRITRYEIFSYAAAIAVLSIVYAFVKAPSLDQILTVIPTVLFTSVILEFVKDYGVCTIGRARGVWTEHRIWYFGLALFLISSLAFRVPFSKPNRLVHKEGSEEETLGLMATSEVLIPISLAGVFALVLFSGFTLLGNIGVVMCLTYALVETIPIRPMNGKEIYSWKRGLWAGLFLFSIALYLWMIFML